MLTCGIKVHNKTFTKFHISSEECARQDKDFLEAEKERMSKMAYAQEYLGEFADGQMQWFKDKLIKRATEQKWFEMQQPQERFTELFNSPKIIYPDCAKEMRACYDIKHSYGTMAMYFIPFDPLIMGILNSSIFDWYSRMTFATFGDPWKGGRIIFKSMYMKKVPIPREKNKETEEITKLVWQILNITKDEGYLTNDSKKERVKQIEKEIDKMVYELYELNPEEIKIVEESGK